MLAGGRVGAPCRHDRPHLLELRRAQLHLLAHRLYAAAHLTHALRPLPLGLLLLRATHRLRLLQLHAQLCLQVVHVK